jgi:hypothetical protein
MCLVKKLMSPFRSFLATIAVWSSLAVSAAPTHAVAQSIGHIDGCSSVAIGPGHNGPIRTNVTFAGWVKEDAGFASPANLNDRPWIWAIVRVPGYAEQSFWFQPEVVNIYRRDVLAAGLAVTHYSGVHHNFVLPGFSYPTISISLGTYKAGGGFQWFGPGVRYCSHSYLL